MTERDRHPPEASLNAPARSAQGIALSRTTAPEHPPSVADEADSACAPFPACLPGSASLWEEWYRHASPEQREQALHLAQTQGHVLHAYQLGKPENGAACAAARPLMPALLEGRREGLAPVRPPAGECFDDDL